MPRYIDIGVALDELGHTPFYDNRDYETAKAMLKSMPTADVAEVKHGKWLVIEDELWKGGGRYECSACGYGFSFDGYFELDELPYCPHCGAKMEVERRDDD